MADIDARVAVCPCTNMQSACEQRKRACNHLRVVLPVVRRVSESGKVNFGDANVDVHAGLIVHDLNGELLVVTASGHGRTRTSAVNCVKLDAAH